MCRGWYFDDLMTSLRVFDGSDVGRDRVAHGPWIGRIRSTYFDDLMIILMVFEVSRFAFS